MSGWIVTLDTPPGVARSQDRLLGFSDASDAVRGVTGAAASLNGETGVISATFEIGAASVQLAVDGAVRLSDAALERIGLPHGNVAHVEAELSGARAAALA